MAWLKPWCFNKKQGRNDPPNKGETTQGKTTQGETTHGRNDSRAKRPGTGYITPTTHQKAFLFGP